MKTAVIIPAYNEKDRIKTVLDAVKEATLIDEIVVVCDGCTDGTEELILSDNELKAVILKENTGKAGAMIQGATNTDSDVILFLDADLIGMDGAKVDAIIKPVIDDKADMSIGVFKGGRGVTDLAQLLVPYISGQRAMKRNLFLEMPDMQETRSGVETAITKYFNARGYRVSKVILEGCTHTMKEEKLGFSKGFTSRLKMYYEISKILFDGKAFK